ncbi:MAG: magnesium/cobalt transporter CorA [Nitrospirota bacterium]|nr:magnesium/cobalt transporter CorA [Nitrospirota bacterium]
MAKMIKKRSKKAGLPPGTLVHIGEQRAEASKITVINYDDADYHEKQLKSVEECFPYKDKPSMTWLNIDGIHQKEILEKLSGCFGFHPLVMEDIMNTDQRPKMEDYADYLYIVLKMLYYNEKENRISTEQVSLIVAPHTVISFQEGLEGDVFGSLRERLKNDKGRIRKMGADYLAYSMIDAVVDSYFMILEKLGEKIELLEEELISDPGMKTLHDIHYLKREMIFLRKAVWPLREVISMMARGESPLIHESMKLYLRDVYDHTIQVIDTIETLRDMVTGMLDIYLSSVSNRLNAVMKVLTIIATIFIPLTFIVGVYGMNFRYMPELEWRLGYPLVWFVMLVIGISMLIVFRKKNWL